MWCFVTILPSCAQYMKIISPKHISVSLAHVRLARMRHVIILNAANRPRKRQIERILSISIKRFLHKIDNLLRNDDDAASNFNLSQ